MSCLRRNVWALALLAGLTGCMHNAVDRRIAEHQEFYDALDTETQERVQHGVVLPGDSIELVQLTAGKPDKVKQHQHTDGETYEIWTYSVLVPKTYGTGSMDERVRSPTYVLEGDQRTTTVDSYNEKKPLYQLIVRAGYVVSVHGHAPRMPDADSPPSHTGLE